uniref:Regulator of G-protein signaling 1 n=1 Tax=Mola mola TaxID=94237 RepID=A0A3Q3X0S0_MOLML
DPVSPKGSLNFHLILDFQKQCTSLDCLKLNSGGQLVFEEFLRSEYSEENLLFWLACENYKTIARETERINIDCVTREEISETLSQPGPNCFDRAQKLIYGLMENDCYPRFLKSEIYQALLEYSKKQTGKTVRTHTGSKS